MGTSSHSQSQAFEDLLARHELAILDSFGEPSAATVFCYADSDHPKGKRNFDTLLAELGTQVVLVEGDGKHEWLDDKFEVRSWDNLSLHALCSLCLDRMALLTLRLQGLQQIRDANPAEYDMEQWLLSAITNRPAEINRVATTINRLGAFTIQLCRDRDYSLVESVNGCLAEGMQKIAVTSGSGHVNRALLPWLKENGIAFTIVGQRRAAPVSTTTETVEYYTLRTDKRNECLATWRALRRCTASKMVK